MSYHEQRQAAKCHLKLYYLAVRIKCINKTCHSITHETFWWANIKTKIIYAWRNRIVRQPGAHKRWAKQSRNLSPSYKIGELKFSRYSLLSKRLSGRRDRLDEQCILHCGHSFLRTRMYFSIHCEDASHVEKKLVQKEQGWRDARFESNIKFGCSHACGGSVPIPRHKSGACTPWMCVCCLLSLGRWDISPAWSKTSAVWE